MSPRRRDTAAMPGLFPVIVASSFNDHPPKNVTCLWLSDLPFLHARDFEIAFLI